MMSQPWKHGMDRGFRSSSKHAQSTSCLHNGAQTARGQPHPRPPSYQPPLASSPDLLLSSRGQPPVASSPDPLLSSRGSRGFLAAVQDHLGSTSRRTSPHGAVHRAASQPRRIEPAQTYTMDDAGAHSPYRPGPWGNNSQQQAQQASPSKQWPGYVEFPFHASPQQQPGAAKLWGGQHPSPRGMSFGEESTAYGSSRDSHHSQRPMRDNDVHRWATCEDLVDQHVAHYLRQNPGLLQRVKISQQQPGVYLINDRVIQVEWQQATMPGGQGYLVAIDHPMRQPFGHYLSMLEADANYALGKQPNPLDVIPRHHRMTFGDPGNSYNRMDAMKVAKAQAQFREKAAEFVHSGQAVPRDLMEKYTRTLDQRLGPAMTDVQRGWDRRQAPSYILGGEPPPPPATIPSTIPRQIPNSVGQAGNPHIDPQARAAWSKPLPPPLPSPAQVNRPALFEAGYASPAAGYGVPTMAASPGALTHNPFLSPPMTYRGVNAPVALPQFTGFQQAVSRQQTAGYAGGGSPPRPWNGAPGVVVMSREWTR